MKKKYIYPTIEMIKINLSQPILSGSIPLSDTETGTQFAPEGDDWIDKAYGFGDWNIE